MFLDIKTSQKLCRTSPHHVLIQIERIFKRPVIRLVIYLCFLSSVFANTISSVGEGHKNTPLGFDLKILSEKSILML